MKIVKKMEHCYLLHEERHYNVNRPTLKLGKTENIISRLRAPNYKKAKIIAVFSVQNSTEIEKHLKASFREKFHNDSEYGSEYFSGDISAMRSEFLRIMQESEIPSIATSLLPDTNIKDEICRLNSIIYDEPTIPTYQEKGNDPDYIVKSFRMASKLNPINIIITDKDTLEGYIAFNESHYGWYKIWNKDSTDEDAEILSLWLKHNLATSHFYSSDKYKTDMLLSRVDDRKKYFLTSVEYDIDAIIEDLITNYYDPNPVFLKEAHYGQYFTSISGGTCLVDLRTLTCQLADSKQRPRFPAHRGCRLSFYQSNLLNLNEVDEKIVQDLLCLLYKDKNLVDTFRKFCYSVLVKPKIDILDLTEEKTANWQLVQFIKDTLTQLNREEDYLLLGPGTDNNETLNQSYIKKLLLANPNNRLWIVYMTTKGKVAKEQLVNNFKKFNIKNVLLVPNKKYNPFEEKDEQVMRKFVKTRVSLSKEKMERVDRNQLYIDEIFDRNDGYLTTHFLKWCATS